MKQELNQDLSGHEVYYTACSLHVILKNSCSKRHCRKGFDLIIFSCKVGPGYQGQRVQFPAQIEKQIQFCFKFVPCSVLSGLPI